VLVADDDADIVRLVEVNLRLEGFEVVTARDGPDVLAKAVAVRFDKDYPNPFRWGSRRPPE